MKNMSKVWTNAELIEKITDHQNHTLLMIKVLQKDEHVEKLLETVLANEFEINEAIAQIIDTQESESVPLDEP